MHGEVWRESCGVVGCLRTAWTLETLKILAKRGFFCAAKVEWSWFELRDDDQPSFPGHLHDIAQFLLNQLWESMTKHP